MYGRSCWPNALTAVWAVGSRDNLTNALRFAKIYSLATGLGARSCAGRSHHFALLSRPSPFPPARLRSGGWARSGLPRSPADNSNAPAKKGKADDTAPPRPADATASAAASDPSADTDMTDAKALRSWVPVAADSDFPIQNLPYGVFRPTAGQPQRIGYALARAPRACRLRRVCCVTRLSCARVSARCGAAVCAVQRCDRRLLCWTCTRWPLPGLFNAARHLGQGACFKTGLNRSWVWAVPRGRRRGPF